MTLKGGACWKPSNVAEIQQFCIDEWARIPPQDYCQLAATTAMTRLRMAQPVMGFTGQSLFHTGSYRF